MPAKSNKQRRFMAAVTNNPKFAKQVGVSKSVGEEFMKKEKGMKKGGMAKMGYMGGGMVKKYRKGGKIDGCAMRGKTKGRMV